MTCSFEKCNVVIGPKSKRGLCSQHRCILNTRKWTAEHKEYYVKRYVENKEKYKEQAANRPKEKIKAKNQKWYQKNRDLAIQKNTEYARNNTGKVNAKAAKYRAAKLKATPKWLSKEQFRQIEDIYKSCPKGYEVDHIVPLQGKEVKGLHVPWNLQHLTVTENSSKSNKVKG